MWCSWCLFVEEGGRGGWHIRRKHESQRVSTLGEKKKREWEMLEEQKRPEKKKQKNEERNVSCTRGEHALTPHSGRSGVDGSGSSGSSSRKGYMCRARNIGYIVLLLAGVGGLPPQSPLKGSSTLERTHYIHLQRIRQRDREK